MSFALPDSRFGMSAVRYNLGVLPTAIPEQDALIAANKLNEHRFLKLTVKQRVFVDAYFANSFDATAAAREIGIPEDEAARAGKKLMKRPEILEAIQLAATYYSEATKLRVDQLMEELKIIALTNITDLINPEDVTVREDVDIDDIRWHAVKSIKRTESKYGTNIEYVMHDKNAAIDKLLKLLAPASQGEPDAGQGNTTNNVTNNNLTQIAIVPVPSGQFLPAPPSPYLAEEGGVVLDFHAASAPTGEMTRIDASALAPGEYVEVIDG